MLRLIDIGLSALYLYGADTVKSSLLSIIYKLVENLLAWSINKWCWDTYIVNIDAFETLPYMVIFYKLLLN